MNSQTRRALHGVAAREGWSLSWNVLHARCPSCAHLPVPAPPPVSISSTPRVARAEIDAGPSKTFIRTPDARVAVLKALRAAQAAISKGDGNPIVNAGHLAVLRRLIESATDTEPEADPAVRDGTEEDRQP